jgi:hypothetical protein
MGSRVRDEIGSEGEGRGPEGIYSCCAATTAAIDVAIWAGRSSGAYHIAARLLMPISCPTVANC